MVEVVSLQDFDIYRDIVEARFQKNVTRCGRFVYRETMEDLGRFNITPAELTRIATTKAHEAEDKYRTERGNTLRVANGLGVGVRAVINLSYFEQLTNTFVPNPPELGAPEVVEVEIPGKKGRAAGLILPNGMFVASSDSADGHSVILYDQARVFSPENPEYVVPASSSKHLGLWDWVVYSVSDSNGGHWSPRVKGIVG
jgi:hypothetical protein